MSELSFLQQASILVGVVSGLGGLVLGIVNTFHQLRQSRPRLVVKPGMRTLVTRYPSDMSRNTVDEDLVVLELHNVGPISVHSSTVGFEGRRRAGDVLIVDPSAIDEGTWPRSIDPGRSCVLRVDLKSTAEAVLGKNMKCACATSQVGEVFRSSRKDMRRFVKSLAKSMARREAAESEGEARKR